MLNVTKSWTAFEKCIMCFSEDIFYGICRTLSGLFILASVNITVL